MQIQLSWDLFIIVIFLIVVAYSFIIGKTHTVKLVISSYLSILASDAIGNALNTVFINANPVINVFKFADTTNAIIILKLMIFITFMVLLATQGAFEIHMSRESTSLEVLITFFFASLSAVLIISSILVFSSGSSFILGGIPVDESHISEMYNQSYLVKLIALNYNLWFSLPVVAFIVMSVVRYEDD